MCDQKDCANNLVLVFLCLVLSFSISIAPFLLYDVSVDGDDDDELGIKVDDVAFVTHFMACVHTSAL